MSNRLLTALLAPWSIAGPAAAADANVSVTAFRTNSLAEPLGIGGTAPRLSWQMDAPRRGVTQSAYEIHVASSADVRYAGPALESHTRYHWAVRVWDDKGVASSWSEPAWFETGLLGAAEWTSSWIGAATDVIGPEWQDYTVEFTAVERLAG